MNYLITSRTAYMHLEEMNYQLVGETAEGIVVSFDNEADELEALNLGLIKPTEWHS